MAEPNRKPEFPDASRPAYPQSRWEGHPSVEELMAAQGTGPITDVSTLLGDFWPEEETIEEFLETLHEWRGHKRRDPAA